MAGRGGVTGRSPHPVPYNEYKHKHGHGKGTSACRVCRSPNGAAS